MDSRNEVLERLWSGYLELNQVREWHAAKRSFFEVVGAELERNDTQRGTLALMMHDVRKVNAANGWNLTKFSDWEDTYKIPAVLALIHSEVSEALEEFRVRDLEAFIEELADVQIRLLDLVGAFPVDFQKAIEDKIRKNQTRPHKHGGKVL